MNCQNFYSQIKVHTIVNSLFSSKTYVIYHNNYNFCYIIDCGDYDKIKKWLKENEKTIVGVFITHTHFDHIYGLNELIKEFPKCVVYTSNNGKYGLASNKFNLSLFQGKDFIFNKEEAIQILSDKNRLELFTGIFINIIETPGHDWSCLSYFIDDLIFTGDSYIPGTKVVDTFPKSNKKKAEESIKLILNQVKSSSIIFPGH